MNVWIFDLNCGECVCVCFCQRLVIVVMTLGVSDKATGGLGIVHRWNRDTCVCVNLGDYYGAANGHR